MTATIGERLAVGLSAEKKIILAVDRLRQTGGKVLVVGCRGDNFPEPYREHPSLVFWEGDDASRAEIPSAVRVVLMTKFVGHSGYNRIHDECVRRNILFGVKLMGTGEIKTLLSPLLADNGQSIEPAAAETAPIGRKERIVSKPKKFARGEQQAFIAEYWNAAAPSVKGEALRLAKIAQARGYATSQLSIMNGFYLTRRRKAETDAAQNALKKAIVPATIGKIGTSAPEPIPPPLGILADDDMELVRMLDEAASKLSDLTAAVGLIREAVTKRSEKRRLLKELLQGL